MINLPDCPLGQRFECVDFMTSLPQALLSRIRSLRAHMAASLRKLLGVTPRDGDFASQRMCPFCGLITPRHRTCCLECGKSLKPA